MLFRSSFTSLIFCFPVTIICEDGYEDMYQRLDVESPLLSQAQELLDKWEKENEGSIAVYNESRSKAVMIDKLVDIIREEVGRSESEN